MGRFKRSGSGKAKRPLREPLPLDVALLPEHFQKIVPIVNNVLFKLYQEKRLKRYEILGAGFDGKLFSFTIKFPFWETISPKVHLFISPRSHECAISQTKGRIDFELLLGKGVTEDQVYDQFFELIMIIEGGLFLETFTIEKLAEYYKTSGVRMSVEKPTEHEDMRKKFDMIVVDEDTKERTGIQLKKKFEDWIQHRNRFPNVPSILVDAQNTAKELDSAVRRIILSAKKQFTEHINLKLLKPPI